MITAEELIKKLRTALQREGDFPASAKIVGELRQLTSDPKTTADQVTEVILREPSLGTRVLHFVNSAFMRRAKPIMTVSQAVVQIGMKPLAEMCAGLVLLQKFVPAARRSGPFALCLKRTVLSSLLTSTMSNVVSSHGIKKSPKDESGYLIGQFAEMGILLLAYYFPEVFEAAAKRAETKRLELSDAIRDITGLTPMQLSLEVVDALGLPNFFREVLIGAGEITEGKTAKQMSPEVERVAKTVVVSTQISGILSGTGSRTDLDRKFSELQNKFNFDLAAAHKVLGELPQVFKEHCGAIDLELPPLPEFVSTYDEANDSANHETSKIRDGSELANFLQEIRDMVANNEPTASIITSVMETVAWGMKFDRVLLLLLSPGKNNLMGRLLLGQTEGIDPKRISIPIGPGAEKNIPVGKAFQESRPVFNGDPVLLNGWPLASFPVGFGAKSIGVIYADKVPPESGEALDLTQQQEATFAMLAELLDRSVNSHGRSS